jgi:4-amino-4-deoxy-L-arabinose transferase-like glycosyltransferase
LLEASGVTPELGTIVAGRWVSALALAALLALTWRLARDLALTSTGALAAIAILTSLVFVQDKGTELRPDLLQNLFWLAGLSLVLRHLPDRKPRPMLLAGLCVGLAVMTNAKAAIGPAFVLVFLLAEPIVGRARWHEALSSIGLMTTGALAAWLPLLAWFAAQGAVGALLEANVYWNLVATAGQRDTGRALEYLRFFVSDQTPFLLLVAAGTALWLGDLASPGGRLDRQRGWLFAVAAAGTTAGWALNLYSQFFLIFLPLLAVIGAFGLERLAARVVTAGGRGVAVLVVAITLGAAVMIREAAIRATFTPHVNLLRQQASTARLLALSPRPEAVGVLWDGCPGFVYREVLQYHWLTDPTTGIAVERVSGANPFGARLVDLLEARRVRFIVGRDDGVLDDLPAATSRYVRENYRYSDCLWERLPR